DVKEFIKDLKEEITHKRLPMSEREIHTVIDKLAGKGLTGKPVNLANG
ncbi:hypothetical protein LCGC14_2792270, partial [marine sediment metagenome]